MTDDLTPALTPMLLMVCDTCRAGDVFLDGLYTEGCVICEAISIEVGDDAHDRLFRASRPARTREEMIEATWLAMRNSWDGFMRPQPHHAAAVLIAAGVIQSEEIDR